MAVSCAAHPRGQCFEAPARNLGVTPTVPDSPETMPACELCGRKDFPRAWAKVQMTPDGKAMKSGCWCARCELITNEARQLWGPGVTPNYTVR